MADIFDLFKKIESASANNNAPISKIIVGLGNPGKEYAFTRHNTGFLALDYISDKLNVKINRSKFASLMCEASFGGKRVLLMQPQTYMNNSGEAVAQAASFYKIAPEDIIVIFDDISLPVGKLRIRKSGSAGGHNGIKSIIAQLGSDKFPRIKVGVGEKPHPEMDLADHVLSQFPKAEQELLFATFGDIYEAAGLMLEGKTDEAMNKYN